MPMAKIIPLFSGSTGNCYYIAGGNTGILIDAGRSAKQITQACSFYNIDIKSLAGILVTHEHSDHIKGLRVFGTKHNLKAYLSEGTAEQLSIDGHLNNLNTEYFENSDNGKYAPFSMGDFLIEPFRTSHDVAESNGFRITLSDGKKICLATDLGFVSDTVSEYLTGCEAVILESNHDVGMLKNGPYPYLLKRRILSDKGHLSNDSCSEILPELVKNGTTRMILAHLSRENNYPDLAYHTATAKLFEHKMMIDKDYTLNVAPEEYNGTVIYL